MIDRAAGKLRKPLPGLRDKDGRWQVTREEVAGAWQRQFASIENAEATTMTILRQMSQPWCTNAFRMRWGCQTEGAQTAPR